VLLSDTASAVLYLGSTLLKSVSFQYFDTIAEVTGRAPITRQDQGQLVDLEKAVAYRISSTSRRSLMQAGVSNRCLVSNTSWGSNSLQQ